MIEEELSRRALDAFFQVYNEVGDGFLERTYQRCLVVALKARGLRVETEVPVSLSYRGVDVGEYRLDLLVERRMILECKAGDRVHLAHEYQLLNYLRATRLPLGFLLNFGPSPTFKRLVNTVTPGAEEKLAMTWKR